MPFQVLQEARQNSLGRDPTVWVLEAEGGDRLEIWPALGFNAYRWLADGDEILYRSPQFFDDLKPTRSGWPILFPFPNRIRDGHFSWNSKHYTLPKNDPAGLNAIHGFTPSRPWRVVDEGAGDSEAWVTGEFDSVQDAADVADLWPAAYRLRVTYRLRAGSNLLVEARVENPGSEPLPFGLGYHPYFRVAPFGGDQAAIGVFACKEWNLIDCLPTGAVSTVSWQEKAFADVQADNLFTDVPIGRPDARECGVIQSPEGPRLVVQAARDFRDLVVFTPPHREAICFEPYTSITDAINLEQRGVDAGLRVLAPGDFWDGWVEVTLTNEPTPAA